MLTRMTLKRTLYLALFGVFLSVVLMLQLRLRHTKHRLQRNHIPIGEALKKHIIHYNSTDVGFIKFVLKQI